MVIDRGARGIAGGLLLLSLAIGFSVRYISIVVLVFLAVWIFIAILTKREYLNAFRKALAKREIDPDKLRININEASTIEALKVSLKSDNDRQVEYALDMLTDVKNVKLQEVVRPLLKHIKPEIRLKTIRILQAQHKTEITGEIEEKINDADPEVRLAAMYYLCQKTGGGDEDLLKKFLENSDPGIFSSAVRCIAEHGNPDQKRLLYDNIFQKLQEQKGEAGKDIRAQSAKALGALNKTEFRAYLMKLFEDSSADVVRQAIKSAGRTKDREFIPVLIKKLVDKQYRLEARNALAEYGNRVIGTLRDYLDDNTVDFVIRRNIPGVLSKIPTQESVNILTISIITTEPPIKYYIIKALNKLRSKYRELKYDRKKIDSALIKETMSYYEVLCVLELSKEREETPAGKLLRKALNEKLDINLEQIFRLLGLRYPSKDIYYAYQGITSNIDRIRSSAVEFMDNTLNSELKKYILPILEEDSPDVIIQQCRKLYNRKIETISEGLEYLIKGRDSWLKACALYIISEEKNEDLISLVKEYLYDPDPVVRETASIVMERM